MLLPEQRSAQAASRRNSGGSRAILALGARQLACADQTRASHRSLSHGADILLAADCTPFAYADFHRHLLPGKALLVGCPKLDDAEYYIEKLASILRAALPRSLTVVRMEVPCCRGLMYIAQEAIKRAGLALGVREIVIGIDGTRKD